MQNSVFDAQYKRLNKAQKDAVDSIEGPVMVIAGPGTGKTSILTLRIANILRLTDTPANGILAITYTDAGVKAMRMKLRAIIGDKSNDVKIHTFHGFASAIIAEYQDHFLHISDMKQMTDIEQESIIRSIIKDKKFANIRPSGKPEAYVSGIIRSIDDAKRGNLTPEMVYEHATKEIKRIKDDESSVSTRGVTKGQLKADAKEQIEKCEKTILFSSVYEIYEDKKRELKRLDFNDLLIELLLALRNDELLLRLLQEKYLYIHVDEHQDTNDVQNSIVSIIAEFFDIPNIFIVGDEKQAIYRFQGASVENFLTFQKKWPAMKIISLDTNYRSHQDILDASFGMIEKNYEEDEHKNLRVELKSGNGVEGNKIDIITGENTTAMEMYLVSALKDINKKDKENNITSTVAIITRRNRELDRVIRLLEQHDIPVYSERSVDIFSHPVGRVFFDLMEYVVDTSRIDSLAKTFTAGLWNLDFAGSLEVIKNLKSGKDTGLQDLKKIQSILLTDSPISFLIQLAEISGFTKLVAKDTSYVHVWRGIITLAESLSRDMDTHDPVKLIGLLLEYRISAESRIVKVSVGASDVPTQALTAHGSKGLEFDYVFIPYATEEAWVMKARGASFILPNKKTIDHDIKDTRRLFYVAVTRARKHVTILSTLEESDGKIQSPLRFIFELSADSVQHKALQRLSVEEIYKNNTNNIFEKSKKGIIDLAKDTLTEKGLSVTALNHFIECPNKFIYQSILKLPQALSVPGEKGNAMHTAIDALWKNEDKSLVNIKNILEIKIIEYFDNSLLSKFEKDNAKQELLNDIEDVAKALEIHFKIGKNANVLTESWVETPFVGVGAGEAVTINLHGKLDSIVDNNSDLYVFDYKTKQAMSINAIKGEIKSSDGSYFRQLVFYKILVSNDSRWRQRRIVPSLVFVSPDDKGRCPTVTLPIENTDIENIKEEIRKLIDSIWSGEILGKKCEDDKCEWCGIMSL